MSQASMDVIVTAQTMLMAEHDVSSETALGLLVWTATERGVTVLDVAHAICHSSPARRDAGGSPLRATA